MQRDKQFGQLKSVHQISSMRRSNGQDWQIPASVTLFCRYGCIVMSAIEPGISAPLAIAIILRWSLLLPFTAGAAIRWRRTGIGSPSPSAGLALRTGRH